jgi:type 1 fimbria pilin
MRHLQAFISRTTRALAMLVFAIMALTLASRASAAPTCSGGSTALTLSAVTVTHDTAVGTLLGTPATGTATFTCSGYPSGFTPPPSTGTRFAIQIYGLTASQFTSGTLPPASSTNITTVTFATNVTGIGLQLTMSPGMRGYDVSSGDQQSGSYIVGYVTGTSGSLSVNYTAQLIVTGAVTPGTVNATTLFNYEWYIYAYNDSQTMGTSLTNSSAQVSLQGCTVNTASQAFAVTLPTVGNTAFTGVGSSAGMTPFNIGLACQAGTTVSITMSTASPNGTYAGVVQPTTGSGYAGNIGVQVLYGGNNVSGASTPKAVTFNSAQTLGASPSGSLSLQYYAQYFQTGTPVSAGNVSATVTFTMSYQ